MRHQPQTSMIVLVRLGRAGPPRNSGLRAGILFCPVSCFCPVSRGTSFATGDGAGKDAVEEFGPGRQHRHWPFRCCSSPLSGAGGGLAGLLEDAAADGSLFGVADPVRSHSAVHQTATQAAQAVTNPGPSGRPTSPLPLSGLLGLPPTSHLPSSLALQEMTHSTGR